MDFPGAQIIAAFQQRGIVTETMTAAMGLTNPRNIVSPKEGLVSETYSLVTTEIAYLEYISVTVTTIVWITLTRMLVTSAVSILILTSDGKIKNKSG